MDSSSLEDLVDIPAEDLLKDMSESIADLINRADNIFRQNMHDDIDLSELFQQDDLTNDLQHDNNDDDDVIYVNSEPLNKIIEVIDLCSPSMHPRKRHNFLRPDSDIEYVDTSIVEIYDDNENQPNQYIPNYTAAKKYKIRPSPVKVESRHHEPKMFCPVCLESATKNKPTSTFCGHIFCHDCIVRSISNTKKCPMCNKKLTLKNIHPIFV